MGESRGAFFDENQRRLADYYLADPDNPYQGSGRSSGAARWEETRRFFADLVHRSGTYLDVGCANGLLLASLLEWLDGTGTTIEPRGVDFVPELVDLAKARVPSGRFWVANAWDWDPPSQFDHVRTNLEYMLVADQVEFVRRQMRWVARGGRLVVAYYPGPHEAAADVVDVVRAAGAVPVGSITVDRVRACWWDAPE